MFRSIAAAAALASLGFGLAASAQTTMLAGPPGAEVQVEADRIVYTWDPPIVRLIGHVVARRGGALVRAGSGTLDRKNGVLKLEGGVLGIQGKQVFLSDAAVVDLNAHTAELQNAVMYLKAIPANPDAPRSGANAVILHGSRVRQLSDGGYLAERVRLTPCDCAGEPDYELIADSAEIRGDRAYLRGTDLRLLGLTLPLFPISMPLTGRQSGLLAPQFSLGLGGPYEFTLAQPVFFTLGPSHDVTIAPGYYTGGHAHQQSYGARSIKGPRTDLEWRYAPVQGTSGSLAFDLYYDLDQHDSPAKPAAFPGEHGTSSGRGFGGLRGIARLNHRSEGDAAVFAVQALAATDVMAARDPVIPSIATSYDSFNTDIGLWRARGPLTIGADATLIQDMRIDPVTIDRRLFGPERRTATQRLPAVFVQLAPIAAGPVTFSVEGSAVQFARLAGPDAQEIATGFAPTESPFGIPTPLPQDGSRSQVLRGDVSPRLAFASRRTFPIDLRLEAAARADGWWMEDHSDRNRARLYGLAGARGSLPLERLYGGGLHRIEPVFEVRALSRPLQAGGSPIGDLADGGGSTFTAAPDGAQQGLFPEPVNAPTPPKILGVPAARRAYDEIDFAAPVTGAVEARASLLQSIWTKPGPLPRRIFQFDLIQDFLLWAEGARARVGEGTALAGVEIGRGSVGGWFAYDWSLHEASSFGASAGIRDARGDEAHVSFGMLRATSSARLRGGIDELFAAARFSVPPAPLSGSARAGVSGPLPYNLRFAYDVTYTPIQAGAGIDTSNIANWIHDAVLAVDTPCKCAGVRLLARAQFHDGRMLSNFPAISVVLDLKSLGSFAY